MEYCQTVLLKNGAACTVRALFLQTHEETDFLASYADESTIDDAQEAEFLRHAAESARHAELLAEVDGRIVGLAGITPVGDKDKMRHRAEFGISVARDAWGLGIGRALTAACIESARRAGYAQVELSVVSDNGAAVALYDRAGFRMYGCNPKGFRTRDGQWQPLVLMRLELTPTD